MHLPEESWLQLDGESAHEYHYFCVYRDLGPQRSIRKAYIHQLPAWRYTRFGRKRYSRLLPGHWVFLSRVHKWHRRALDYDQYLGVTRIPVPVLRMFEELLATQPASHKRNQVFSQKALSWD